MEDKSTNTNQSTRKENNNLAKKRLENVGIAAVAFVDMKEAENRNQKIQIVVFYHQRPRARAAVHTAETFQKLYFVHSIWYMPTAVKLSMPSTVPHCSALVEMCRSFSSDRAAEQPVRRRTLDGNQASAALA